MSAILPSVYGPDALDRIRHEVARRPHSRLDARRFFPARDGVLTLVYAGFPSPLVEIKNLLEEMLPGLGPEDEGSKWPKTTLAAVRDGTTLDPDRVARLLQLCAEANEQLEKTPVRVPVLSIDVVRYMCRSLERDKTPVRLEFDAIMSDNSVPSTHLEAVEGVLEQADEPHVRSYAPQVGGSGHRCSHYRERSTGWSLVVSSPVGELEPVRLFRSRVENALPDVFSWFASNSLHVTVRSLNPTG